MYRTSVRMVKWLLCLIWTVQYLWVSFKAQHKKVSYYYWFSLYDIYGGAWFTLCLALVTLPLLVPSGPRSTVHSSMLPKGSNIFLTSVSVCCFPSMPTNSFLSSKGKEIRRMGGKRGGNDIEEGVKREWVIYEWGGTGSEEQGEVPCHHYSNTNMQPWIIK